VKRLIITSALFLLLVGAAPTADAQAPEGDFVSGTVTVTGGFAGATQLTFGASSSPSGENATGLVSAQLLDFGVFLDFQVACLVVEGSAATVGARYFDRPLGEQLLYLQVIDGGPGRPDRIGTPATGSARDCAEPPLPFTSLLTITSGDVVVVDSEPLPTDARPCKNGGWRSYGVFKNQGDCVSFVASGGRNLPAGP
jgi:hypothetical protein